MMKRTSGALIRVVLVSFWIAYARAFAPPSRSWTNYRPATTGRLSASTNSADFFFASSDATDATDATTTIAESETSETSTENSQNEERPFAPQTRVLGSQELLMLPRQYMDSDFPQMNHVSVALLKGTIDPKKLETALQLLTQSHPLLSARVQGTGEPDKRIDLFQMVRSGEPSPLTFVTTDTATPKFQVVTTDTLESSWKTAFQRDLDDFSWCDPYQGPLWKTELHTDGTDSALLLSFNHAISDQGSAHRLLDQLLQVLDALDRNNPLPTVSTAPMPVSLEDSVMGKHQRWSDVQLDGLSIDTAKYVLGKAAEGLRNPVILPDAKRDSSKNNLAGSLSLIAGQTAGGTDKEQRRSTVQFRTVPKDTMEKLLEQCRQRKLSVSHALTAAVTFTTTDFIGEGQSRNYKVLQSLDMRRFGKQLDPADTVSCMAGSHDLMHGPLPDQSGQALRNNPSAPRVEEFWKLAQSSRAQTQEFIESGGPYQAVRVFDFAMTISDLNNLVNLSAQSKDTKGRAYSAGVTNVGVFEATQSFDKSHTLQLKRGKYEIQDIFFATPHVTSGCLFQVSALTMNGELKLTFNPVEPIVSDETNAQFADAFVDVLEKVVSKPVEHVEEIKMTLPDNILTTAALVLGTVAVASHAGAWAEFFQSVLAMKANVADPSDFWAALNFWIFFAVGHPILQPILWVSDVLHGSPGPMVAGLVPATFLLGNAVVIAAITISKDLRNAVNVAALAAFFTYVGAGLDGTAGLGDFNLALDDSYKGQIVKGCPAYEEVRQPSMDNFNLEKYQGLWYEQKFHDWTQFKEVYDTTLGIKLTEGGKAWVDDFAVKGPAPDAAPLSWDKSPVANGAHYFLFGRVDPKDPPGILRESGFGVEFPNYIVDVKKDPASGEYTEAIQFQCLERGGVRVFEGINFMSRSPTMTSDEMTAMHARAEKAGMYPYGATPDQMHSVARRPVDAPEIDNNWQAMWRAIGVDKLLELLTESIEDGGR